MNRGKIFVISAPSGAGKTTLTSQLLSKMPNELARSISCTTRPPRGDEKDSIDYIFLSEEEFEKRYKRGEFLETAHIYGYHYGTLRESVEELLKQGKNVILVIDVQGAEQLKDRDDVIYIFISPPSMEELEKRIFGRKEDNPTMIKKRLDRASKEMKKRFDYDHVIVNDQVDTAVNELKEIIKGYL